MRRTSASNGGGSLTRIAGVSLFGLASLATFVTTQFWSESDFGWGPGAMALLAGLLFLLHLALVWRRSTPLDPVVWLPMALLFFYFGVPVAVEGIGGPEFNYDPWQIGPPINLSRGYCGAVLAFAAFLMGMHLAGVRDLSKVKATPSPDQSLALPALVLTLGAITMLAVGVVLVGPSVVFGIYENWWGAKRAGADPRFIEIGIVFAQAGTFGLIASHHPRRRYRLYVAATVAALLMFVAIEKGARSTLMATAVGLVWCYSQRVRRLNSAIVSVVALSGVLLFPLLGEYRVTKQFEVENRRFVHLFARSMRDMGSTVNTLIYTMDIVPQREDYAWGVAYVEAVYQLIPNLGLTPNRDDRLTGSLKAHHSNWLTWQVNPDWAPVGGYGSSMAGELFFNFGVLGMMLGCALIGFVGGWLRSAAQDSALKLTASALFFGSMIIHVRNPIGPPLRNVVWSLLALLIIRGLVSQLASRSTNPPVSRPVQL